jgi:hypothetical protein
LLLASADGREQMVVADGIDMLLGRHVTASGSLLLFYSRRGAARVAEADLSTRKITSDNVLSESR